MVGQLLQRPGDKRTLVFRQRLRVVLHAQGVLAHGFNLVVGQYPGHQEPPAHIEEVFLLVGQRDDQLAIGVFLRQVAFLQQQRLPQILIHYVCFAHLVHPLLILLKSRKT